MAASISIAEITTDMYLLFEDRIKDSARNS
jgi:hypothetical protein